MKKQNYRVRVSDPYITEEEVSAVAQAVREKRLSQGEYVSKFEHEFAERLGVKHAIAVNSGTAALHVALAAFDVGPGNEVLIPSFSYISTGNCVLYQRANPIFVDIDSLTFNLDAAKIREKTSDKCKVIIPVHYAGQPADMDFINEVAKERDIFVVEDAAEAFGAMYKDRKAGSLGDIGCFSFYPNKNITTGEGGMVTTNDDDLADKIRMLRSQGQDSRYHHVILGYNYRMTDIQAALGLVQIKRLNWTIERKKEAAEYYNKNLKEVKDLSVPYKTPYATHAYYAYNLRFKNHRLRNETQQGLEELGVETRITFPPIHLQPLYRRLFGYSEGSLPVTENVAETILSIPIYPHITKEDQDYVISCLLKLINT